MSTPPPPKPFKIEDDVKTAFGLFYFLLLLAIPSAICVYLYDDLWLAKHTSFPYIGSGRAGDTRIRSDAFAYTADFLESHKAAVIGSTLAYSDAPWWNRRCGKDEYEVRVIGPVIDPGTGASNDITMLFCFTEPNFVRPLNQQAEFYTRN